jgi:filamentous hemagglutinin family protein
MRNQRRLHPRVSPACRRLPLAGAIMTALLGLQVQRAESQALPAGALPTNGQVVYGTANISQAGNAMQVHQSSGKLITEWSSFNIGSGARVDFLQPSTSAMALNRVLSADPSRIYGQLNANGQVFLVNPAGVLFAPGSKVNVGGLVASTLDISNADFAAGNFRFAGSAGGEVANEGEITTAERGYAALLGPRVRNAGSIVARLGTVALAAGDAVTLDLHGDQLLNLQIDAASAAALAANSGALRADGGLVLLAARGAGDPLATVLNNTGTVHATSLANHNGVIRLEGGDSGVVAVSGTLDASGRQAGETGGTVKVLGDKVGLFDGARIDASGDAGGGTVLVGGNWQGSGAEQRASASFVGRDALIRADALSQGHGGTVVVWADGSTRFYGTLSAQGGAAGGHGGLAEVSGKTYLDFDGTARLTATGGVAGTLLLDPTDITISGGANAAAWNGTDTFTGAGNTSILNVDTLLAQLALGKVIVSTASAGGGNGDITVSSAINYTGGNSSLTLSATRDINVNADIKSTGAGKLDITLTGAAGRVLLGNNDATQEVISSNGGNISITGTGRSGAGNGILMQGAAVQSGSGKIDMTGTGSAGSQGISLNNSTLFAGVNNLIESTSGAITMTGINAATGSGFGFNAGTNTVRSTSTVAGEGNITIVAKSTGASGSIGLTMGSSGTNSIRTAGGHIDVTAESASSSSALSLGSGTNTIESTGVGNVTLRGTSSGSGNGIASGTGNNAFAVKTGNLLLDGKATGTGDGMAFTTGTLAISASGGDITLSGTTSNSGSTGVTFSSSATTKVSNTTGKIAINGSNTSSTANAGNTGVGFVSSSNGVTIETTTGAIGLTGSTVNGGTALKLAPTGTGSLTVRTTGAGQITLTGDTVTIGDKASLQTTGAGSLVLQPLADATTVSVAATGGTFDLDATELARIQDGFSSITIGRATGTGAVTVGAATFTDNLVLRQASGGMSFTGALTLGSNSLSLTSGGGAISDLQIASAKSATVNAAGAVSFGSSTLTGPLSVTTSGAITQSAASALAIGGMTTLEAGKANNITLTEAGNNFGTVAITSANDVSLRDATTLDLGASGVSGHLTLRAGGAITQSGALTVGGNLSLTTDHLAGDVTISNKAAAATTLGDTRVGNNYTLVSGGEISQAGGTTLVIGNNFSVSGGSLSAPAAGNVIGGTDNSAGAGTVIKQVGVVDLSTRDIGSGAGVITVGGNLSVQSLASADTIQSTVGAGVTAINLAHAGNSIGGAISVNASAPTVTPSGAPVATGIVQNGATLSVGGNASFSAAASAANAGGVAGNITLDGAANQFNGLVSFSGNNVLIRSATALALGSSSATGTLSLVTAGAGIAGNAALLVGGDASFTADGKNADIELTNSNNSFGGKLSFAGAGGLRNLSVTDTSDVDLQALTLSGNLQVKAAAITDSGALSIGGTTGLQATGAVVLDNAGHGFKGAVSLNAASATLASAGALDLGASKLGGNLSITSNGAVTQSGALSVGGNLALVTTHAAGDVVLNNSGAASTTLGNTTVGGDFNVTAAGKNVTQAAGSKINVAGDFSVTAGSVSTNPADNLIGGTDNTLAGGTFIKKVGVVTLDNINTAGNLTVLSLATGQVFAGPAVHGSAINLSNAGNNIGGTVSVQTSGPAIISSGAPVATGIVQTAGTTVQVGGVSSFAASGGDVNLGNAGNVFGGAVSASGNNITLRGTGALQLGAINASGNLRLIATGGVSQAASTVLATGTTSVDAGAGAIVLATAGNDFGGAVTLSNTSGGIAITDTNALALGPVNAAGSLAVSAGGATTLNADIAGTGVTFAGAGAGAVVLGADVAIDARTGTLTLGAMTGGARNLTLTSDNIVLSGNWSGTGAYTLRTASDATTIGLAGASGSYALSTAELANIAAANSSQVTIGRATGTGLMTVGAMTFDDKLALQGGAITFSAGNQSFGNGLTVTGTGRVQLSGATVTATGGDVTITGVGAGATQGFSMTGSAQLRTTSGSGHITVNASNASGTAFSMGSGTNTIQADGTGNVTISGTATGGSGFGMSVGSGGTNTIRSADGNVSLTAQSAGTDTALSLGSGTNLVEATGKGQITATGTATGGGTGVTFATSGANGMRTASGTLSITGSATGAGVGVSLGSGAHTLASATGNIAISGTSNGSGNGVSFATGTNTVEAGGSGNVSITATSLGATGFGLSMGTNGTGTVRVANGTITVNASSVGDDTALSTGSGTNTLRATGSGSIAVNAAASGTANGLSMGSGGTNLIAVNTGSVTINATGAGDGTGMAMTSGTNAVTTAGGNIAIDAKALGDGDGFAMSSGTNTVAAGGAGNLTLTGYAPLGNAVSLGTASKTAGTSTLRVANGVLTVNATAGGSTSALNFGVSSGAAGPATNTIEATLEGQVVINAANTGTGNGVSMGSQSNNTIRSGAGSIAVTGTAAQGVGLSMATGNNTIASGAGGVTVAGTSQGNSNGITFGSTSGDSNNLVSAGGSGNLSVTGVSEGSTSGFGVSLGNQSNNVLRVQDGTLALNGRSAGSGSAITMGSGTSTVEATGSGNVKVNAESTGTGNAFSMSLGNNIVRTVSGTLDVAGLARGAGEGISMGSGVNTLQSTSGAVNLTGTALGTGNGFYITSSGKDSVLTDSGAITITGSSTGGLAIALRPTAQQATIEATGAGSVNFRADNYDATPSGSGSVRIAGNGGTLSIVQLTPGTSIGIGAGAQGLLNWSGAEVAQVSGFGQVRIGNLASGALDLRPPWFPFPMVLPPSTLTADEQKYDAVKAAVEKLLTNYATIGQRPPTLAVTRRFNLLIQGFDDEKKR